MAADVTLSWTDSPGDNDGKLSLWLSHPEGLFAVGSEVEDTTVTLFEDDDTKAFIGLELLEPDAAIHYRDVLLRQPFPSVDVPQAGLKDVHPADALLWGYEHLNPRQAVKRSYSG